MKPIKIYCEFCKSAELGEYYPPEDEPMEVSLAKTQKGYLCAECAPIPESSDFVEDDGA